MKRENFWYGIVLFFSLAVIAGTFFLRQPTTSQGGGTSSEDATEEKIFVGLVARSVPGELAGDLPGGVLVAQVIPDSPAAHAGIRKGEIVWKVDGRPVENLVHFVRTMRSLPPGRNVGLLLLDPEAANGAAEARKVTLRLGRESLAADVRKAMVRGARFLVRAQREDGAWNHFQGVVEKPSSALSAFVLYALASLPEESRTDMAGTLDRGAAFLLERMDAGGTIVDPEEEVRLANYATALTLAALHELDPKEHGEAIDRLREGLVKRQLGARGRFGPYDWRYGSWNYYEGSAPDVLRADLSLHTYVLECLRRGGVKTDATVVKRSRHFLKKTQNLGGGEAASHLDGGFAFSPRESKAGMVEIETDGGGEEELIDDLEGLGTRYAFRSYGSATADGLRGLLLAGHSPDAPPVVAAVGWFRRHWRLDRIPGFPKKIARMVPWDKGMHFYYLRSLSDALALLGEDRFETADGRSHRWAREMAVVLLPLQRDDGAWKNEVALMNEDSPVLATALNLLTLATVLEHLEGD